ncbi:MAG TPA: hypothetical protein VF970_08670 [Gemmatimonadales bacterium]
MRGLFTYIEGGVLAGALMLVLYATAAGAVTGGRARAGLVAGATALAWFVLLWEAARLGVFEGGSTGWRLAIAVAAVLPVVIGGARAPWLARHLVSAGAPPASLVTIQVCRMVSAALLIALAGEALPAWVAVPAGAGDLVIAGFTPMVARMVARGDPRASGVVAAWAVAGIAVSAYLVSAVVLGGRTATYFLTLYPLVLIPVFITPVVVMLQIVATKVVPTRP